MDSNEESTITNITAAESERNEQQQEAASCISLSKDSSTQHGIPFRKTDGNEVSVESLSASADFSSEADNERLLEATANADSLAYSASNEAVGNICQGREIETSVENLLSETNTGNLCDGTKAELAFDGNALVLTPTADVIQTEEDSGFNVDTDNAFPTSAKVVKTLGPLKFCTVQNMPQLTSHKLSRNLTESEIYLLKSRSCQKLVLSLYSSDEYFPQNVSDLDQEAGVETAESSVREISGEDYERKAFFYISSSSIPGMEEGSERPSVSGGYQVPDEGPIRCIVRQTSREPPKCLGTQTCHIVILIIAVLTVVLGCVLYHMSKNGIVPAVLKPIGASTAFISFAVCVFSSIYITYLRNYPQFPPVVPNYGTFGDIESVMAMNRDSNPEEERYYTAMNRTDASGYNFRQTRYADLLDRYGYWRQPPGSQTEVKRYSDESGTAYSNQSSKRFKVETEVERIRLTELELERFSDGQTVIRQSTGKEIDSDSSERSDVQAAVIPDAGEKTDENVDNSQDRTNTAADLSPDCQNSDISSESEIKPLLPERNA